MKWTWFWTLKAEKRLWSHLFFRLFSYFLKLCAWGLLFEQDLVRMFCIGRHDLRRTSLRLGFFEKRIFWTTLTPWLCLTHLSAVFAYNVAKKLEFHTYEMTFVCMNPQFVCAKSSKLSLSWTRCSSGETKLGLFIKKRNTPSEVRSTSTFSTKQRK